GRSRRRTHARLVSRRAGAARSVRDRAAAVAARGVRRPDDAARRRHSRRVSLLRRARRVVGRAVPALRRIGRDGLLSHGHGRRAAGGVGRPDVPLPRHLAPYRVGPRQRPGRDSAVLSLNTHVDFIAILFVVWGALITVIGLSTLALGVGAATLANSDAGGRQVAAGLTAFAFITLAVIAILWGIGHVFIGIPLRKRSPKARLLAILAGSIDLILLPIGTPLGIYALWVLLNERAKALFGVRYS